MGVAYSSSVYSLWVLGEKLIWPLNFRDLGKQKGGLTEGPPCWPALWLVLKPQNPDRGLSPRELSLTGERNGHSGEMRGSAVVVLSDGLQMVEAREMDEGHRASEDSVPVS